MVSVDNANMFGGFDDDGGGCFLCIILVILFRLCWSLNPQYIVLIIFFHRGNFRFPPLRFEVFTLINYMSVFSTVR